MAKNKITDLRDHLFATIEALQDPEEKHMTIERAAAIKDVAQVIVNSAKVEVEMIKAVEKADGIIHPTKFFITEVEQQKSIEQNAKH